MTLKTKKGIGFCVKPKHFKIRIDNCGTDALNGGYKLMKDKNAMKLANNVCFIMSKSFVPKDQEGSFIYELAIHLLAQTNYPNKEEVLTDIEDFKKKGIQGWELKE